MKILRKIMCFVVPCFLVIAITLGIVLPLTSKNRANEEKEELVRKAITAIADETGASTADKSKKGGAIFLEENTSYTMSGGTISKKKNTYGGAVFVSKGATFTMESGTISNCYAKYGGAIYVASGGICNINGGSIINNTAEFFPVIYVEPGGQLTFSNSITIEGNDIGTYLEIGPDVVLGRADGTLKLPTVEFGMYPKTYVGAEMNATLENWYSTQNPVAGEPYVVRTRTWTSYTYTDGNIYVRGTAYRYDSTDSTYKDGTLAENVISWFKVEPITWYILNYDAWKAGEEDMELYSELVVTADIYFNASTSDGNNWGTSYIRGWLKDTFYNEAFDASEKALIKKSTIGNNVTGDYSNADSDTKGNPTEDYIYLKSYYEMSQAPFTSSALRIAAASDFAIANYAYMTSENSSSYGTAYRPDRSAYYWLRSAGLSASTACRVSDTGGPLYSTNVYNNYSGVRPALRLNI